MIGIYLPRSSCYFNILSLQFCPGSLFRVLNPFRADRSEACKGPKFTLCQVWAWEVCNKIIKLGT